MEYLAVQSLCSVPNLKFNVVNDHDKSSVIPLHHHQVLIFV